MKRFILITILAILGGMSAMAQNNPLSNHTSGGGDHNFNGGSRGFVRAGFMLTYNSTDQLITVNGLQEYVNYTVLIVSMTTQQEWTDVVTREANVIGVSYLEEGKYKITLEGSDGTSYTYTLNIGTGTMGFDWILYPQGGQAGGANSVFVDPTPSY